MRYLIGKIQKPNSIDVNVFQQWSLKSSMIIAWFTNLREFDGGKVLLGDNSECMIKEIGSIRLNIDGTSDKITSYVRYVPYNKNTLISASMLNTTGYSIKVENDYTRVVRGSLVVLKANKQNDLDVFLTTQQLREL